MHAGKLLRVTAAIILSILFVADGRSSAAAAVGNASEHPAVLLKSCWNDAFDPAPRGFKDWLAGRRTSLHLSGVWWSNRSSTVPLTVFTMASRDRLTLLEAQCRNYVGPLVAAIHVPLLVRRSNRRSNNGTATARGRSGGSDSGDGRRLHRRGLKEQQQEKQQQQGRWQQQQQQQQQQHHESSTSHATPWMEAELSAGGKSSEHGRGPQMNAVWAELQALFDRMESGAVAAAGPDGDTGTGTGCCCQLRLLLFTERVADRPLAAVMPTNAMRNAAMTAVQTPLAIMLDVDLGINEALNRLISNKTWADAWIGHAIGDIPKYFIPPAFEPNPKLDMRTASRVADDVIRGDKENVLDLWLKKKTLSVFQEDVCYNCHAAFNHSMWATATKAYGIQYQRWFEPWGVLWRFHDPGYDERFRGWYFDKISYLETLGHFWNFVFVVLPDFWLVHRPHAKVAIAQLHSKKGNSTAIADIAAAAAAAAARSTDPAVQALLQLKRLGRAREEATAYQHYLTYAKAQQVAVRLMVSEGAGYTPQLNPQLLHCRRVLPWWRGEGKISEQW